MCATIILGLVMLFSTVAFVHYQSVTAAIKAAEIEADKVTTVQTEKTTRTEERWGFLPWNRDRDEEKHTP